MKIELLHVTFTIEIKMKENILIILTSTIGASCFISASHDHFSPKPYKSSGGFEANTTVSAGNNNRFTFHAPQHWGRTVREKGLLSI